MLIRDMQYLVVMHCVESAASKGRHKRKRNESEAGSSSKKSRKRARPQAKEVHKKAKVRKSQLERRNIR